MKRTGTSAESSRTAPLFYVWLDYISPWFYKNILFANVFGQNVCTCICCLREQHMAGSGALQWDKREIDQRCVFACILGFLMQITEHGASSFIPLD